MSKSRASKGYLLSPAKDANLSEAKRSQWLTDAFAGFVQPSLANREIYKCLLLAFWPEGHGLPGPVLSQDDIRKEVDTLRAKEGKPPYKDVFRRLRELQGEEGFTGIVKEGVRYQLQRLELSPKRQPRESMDPALWQSIKAKYGFRCASCGQQEPSVKLSPDHRVPRQRGGGNEAMNIQPLCEQCNNIKSSTCQGCTQNCLICPWAFPETFKPIVIDDQNREAIRREAERSGKNQSDLANTILRKYFHG